MIPTDFSPVPAAIGGALIGAAAVLLMLTTGRIAGISNYLARVLPPWTDTLTLARIAFLGGLIAAPVVYTAATGTVIDHALAGGPLLLAGAGLLVGFGTVVGNGCTSGHGVCGLARVSRRSIAATATFMAAGVAAVFVLRHVVGS
ncbi:MAG: YeeE/YedE family protein [Hyphomicrobium sp.]|jgi:uncharacterized membrane protein YedE/YeeE|nr:YeeE/YedE family protein [Hyphomicrobium sp.]